MCLLTVPEGTCLPHQLFRAGLGSALLYKVIGYSCPSAHGQRLFVRVMDKELIAGKLVWIPMWAGLGLSADTFFFLPFSSSSFCFWSQWFWQFHWWSSLRNWSQQCLVVSERRLYRRDQVDGGRFHLAWSPKLSSFWAEPWIISSVDSAALPASVELACHSIPLRISTQCLRQTSN